MRISTPQPGRDEQGMAVILVIAILSIILIFVAGNLRALHLLRNDVRLIEKQQTNRLASVGPITNSPPITNTAPAVLEDTPAPALHPK
jgi:hypothetical protein